MYVEAVCLVKLGAFAEGAVNRVDFVGPILGVDIQP